jgi:hypothetical protein
MREIPVLLLTFRRPEMVRQQLELLAAAGPLRCYVACDGPRTGNWAEAQAVASVQSVVAEYAKHLDLRTQFQEVNLGCGRGVSTAINWFFECETEGIILEDDCHPSAGFFAFCVELLERYRNVSHVMQIAGYNRLSPLDWIDSDYIFSNYGCQWGWATWRRAWDHFDLKMAGWPRFKEHGLHRGPTFNPERIRLLDATYAGAVDTWDYQWAFAMAAQSGLSVVPRVNLVTNVGFEGPGGTHYGQGSRRPQRNPAVGKLPIPLRHPDFFYADPEYDRRMVEASKKPALPIRAWRRLRDITKSRRG